MINEATGVDLTTVTSGYRTSYKSFENDEDRRKFFELVVSIYHKYDSRRQTFKDYGALTQAQYPAGSKCQNYLCERGF